MAKCSSESQVLVCPVCLGAGQAGVGDGGRVRGVGSSLGTREPAGREAQWPTPSGHSSHPSWSPVLMSSGKEENAPRVSDSAGWDLASSVPKNRVPPAPLLLGPGATGLKASSLSQGPAGCLIR